MIIIIPIIIEQSIMQRYFLKKVVFIEHENGNWVFGCEKLKKNFVGISGIGSYLPGRVLTNDELSKAGILAMNG